MKKRTWIQNETHCNVNKKCGDPRFVLTVTEAIPNKNNATLFGRYCVILRLSADLPSTNRFELFYSGLNYFVQCNSLQN